MRSGQPATRCRAHPRSRGENRRRPDKVPPVRGSSSLTRGKRISTCDPWRGGGLIPAHAGKTSPAARLHRRAAAHPRSRGENLEDARTDHLHSGSSPLTRGKLAALTDRCRPCRLIPAHAGKTSLSGSVARSSAAHPRSRGENLARPGRRPRRRGSSPLTRGKPRVDLALRAGYRAHPRSRGENTAVTV